ncbi:MAG: acyltransferase family protein [Eubacteriales bacterium]|nr:acyltransferase family protein [Eubacteriales bacterium]
MENCEIQSKPVKKNFDAIDGCKLIAALFVVGIHTTPLDSWSEAANFALFECLSRFAVPFFFASSAFFFFRGGVDGKKLWHYERRMAILYAIWFLVAFPVTFARKYWVLFTDYPLSVAIWRTVRGFLFASSFRGSWFLSGSMFCAAVIYFLSKKLTTKQIMRIAGVFYIFCVLCSTYGKLIYWVGLGAQYETFLFYFAHPYTSIITGLLYFAIGKYFAEHEQEVTQKDPKKYLLLSAISMAGAFLEMTVAQILGLVQSTDCCFMLIPNVYFLMTTALCSRIHLKHVKEIRASGVIVFFAHFSVLYAFQMIDKYCGIHFDTWTRYLLILLISFSFASFVLHMEDRKHWRWMHYLH